jgi:hypothetical protein
MGMREQDDPTPTTSAGRRAAAEQRGTAASGAVSTEGNRATNDDLSHDDPRLHGAERARQPDAPMTTPPTVIREDPFPIRERLPLRDRVRWGPIWAGLVVALGTYLILQLALVATGVIDLGAADTGDAWLSAGAALLAFLIGGITTGASAMWDGVDDGILHGVIMWAVGVVALIALSIFGSNLALGALDASNAFENVRIDLDTGTVEGVDVETGLGADDAQEAASWVLLGLGAALLAAVIGGAIGAILWPRRGDADYRDSDTHDRTRAY